MAQQRKKFSSEVEAALLRSLQDIAVAEGRPFHGVLEEAMERYIEARTTPLYSVLEHFQDSIHRNRRLGELLAK